MSAHVDTLELTEFHSTTPGNHLVVLARVHGNEPCGQVAISRVIREIQTRKVLLRSGRVTFVPQCNPRGTREDKRFIDANLNRVFTSHRRPRNYEESIANALVDMIGRPTLMLDLHSYPSNDRHAAAFVLKEYTNAMCERAIERLKASYVLSGWQDLQVAHRRPKVFSSIAQTTKLGIPGIGLECGEHRARASAEVAYEAIRTTMDTLAIAPYQRVVSETPQATRLHFRELHLYPKDGGRFTRSWEDFATVRTGDVIARSSSGREVRSRTDGRLVLPNFNAKPGEEWFYVAQEL